MHAIVLAGGLASRLRPLTDTIPKPLLPLAGRPMLDYTIDKLSASESIEGVSVVSSRRFEGAFERWSAALDAGAPPIEVLYNDVAGARDRTGPLRGGVMLAVEERGLWEHDLLIIAGDNVFESGLSEFIDFFHARGDATCICSHRFPTARVAEHYGVVDVDEEGRLRGILEEARSDDDRDAHVSIQILHRAHVRRLVEYLDTTERSHRARHFLNWLVEREPVYVRSLEGTWIDAGTKDDLLLADNWYRARRGLPSVERYTPAPFAGRDGPAITPP